MLRRTIAAIAALLLLYAVVAIAFAPARNPRCFLLFIDSMPDSLPVPVRGVKPRQLRDTWGAARSGGRRHEGIDIFARRNTPVLSVSSGIVTRKGWNSLGGRTVTILGPGGYHHYYAHLESYAPPNVGEWVDAGEVIGYVGDSGNAKGTPTHLHYGIYRFSGGAIDPYPFLADTSGSR